MMRVSMMRVWFLAALIGGTIALCAPARADEGRPEWHTGTQASSKAVSGSTNVRNALGRMRTPKVTQSYSARNGTSLYGRKGVYEPGKFGAKSRARSVTSPIAFADSAPVN